MSRDLDDWLDAYLVYTQNTEPPVSYHTWCGLSLIAGSLQRKVHLTWGFETIYPNLFVILVGQSGRTRKGAAIGIAKDLLLQVQGVSVAPEASNREVIVSAMKRGMQNFTDADGVIRMHCSLTAFSEELAVFLGQGDIKLLANLTDWYDSKSNWTYETIGRGRDSLQGLCFNLMGATAPDWIQSMLPQEAVGGGFTSRVIFVVEEQKGKIVPEHHKTKEEQELEWSLVADLGRIQQIVGEFKFNPKAKQRYTDWYVSEDEKLSKGEPAVSDTRFAGYCERRATHIRKLMMLCSVSRSDQLVIDVQDFDRGLEILKMTERKMGKTFGGLGKAKDSDVTQQVLDYIQKVGAVTRTSIMQRFYRDLTPDGLRVIEDTGVQMKVLRVKLIPDQNEKVYLWQTSNGPSN